MQRARLQQAYRCAEFPDISLGRICWPDSTVRCTGDDPAQLMAFADRLLDAWRDYSDASVEIRAYTTENGQQVPHNTVTPILHHTAEEGYVLDLVPRNNAVSPEHPEGIFHPHREIHHIKKENIGLIEVMGLAILPSRLKPQGEAIRQVLTGARARCV